MFDKAIEWIQKRWWGLIVAHILVLVTAYLIIWNFAEPLGIPDTLENLPSFVKSRVFIHLVLTLIIGAYITLVLDIGLRRKNWTKAQSNQADSISEYRRLTKGLRRIVHLLPSDLRIENWKISHTIDKDGTDTLREELTLIPPKDPVYFYFKRFLVPHNSKEATTIKASAENMLDNTPLVMFELERSEKYIH